MSAARSYVTRERASRIASYRLTNERQEELAQVARGEEESLVGMRTRYFVDLSGDAGVRDVEAVHLFDAERVLEEHRAQLAQLGRCRRALRTMLRAEDLNAHVGALFAVYGWPDPWADRCLPSAWGELRYLARFTDAVEGRRKHLVRELVRARLSPTTPRLDEARRFTAFYDRQTTSRDAVLAVLRLPAETRKEVEREILAQADAMVASASRAYHETWVRS